jgi:hypothetical protein
MRYFGAIVNADRLARGKPSCRSLLFFSGNLYTKIPLAAAPVLCLTNYVNKEKYNWIEEISLEE